MTDQSPLLSRLVRLLPWAHLLCLVAVLLQPTQPAIILQRYSRTSVMVFAALLVSLPVVVWLSRWVNPRLETLALRVKPYQHRIILIIAAILLFGLGVLASFPTTSYVILSFYGVYIGYIIGLWSLSTLSYSDERYRGWAAWVGAGVVVVLLLLATRYPGQLWTDEGYNANLAFSIGHNGQFAVPMFRLTPQLYGPIYSLTYIVLAGVYRLFGVELAVGRVVFYAIGLLTIWVTSRVCRRFYSPAVTWIVCLVAAVVLLAGNYMRADIEVALWLALSLWAFVIAQQSGKQLWHLAVGLAVGFSVDGHPNAYRFAIVYAVIYALEYLLQVRASRRWLVPYALIFCVVGIFLGLIAYIGLYSLLASAAFGSRVQSLQFALNLGTFFPLLTEYFVSALESGSLLFVLALVGFALSLRRREAFDRLVVGVPLISTVFLALAYGYYRDYYFIHLLPFYIVLAVVPLHVVERRLATQNTYLLMNRLMLLFVCVSIGWLFNKIVSNRAQDYGQAQDVASQLRDYIPLDETIIGVDPLYFRMTDYPNLVEFNVGLYMAVRDKIDEQQAWGQIGATSIVIFESYPIKPPASLLAYVQEQQFTLVHCWDGNQVGRVDLYMKTVPEGISPTDTCDPLTY